jgi:hypothetical protein
MPQSYIHLIDIAKNCFKMLLLELRDSSIFTTSHTNRAKQLLQQHDSIDYSKSSFMNLFNYSYGHLAPHRDRCLVTVVFTKPHDSHDNTSDKHLHKNLWCLEPHLDQYNIKNWTSIDILSEKVGSSSVCLHVGEELSVLYDHKLLPALHCVQVDPTATEKPPTHEHRHGDTHYRKHNRLSAALILSAADISAMVEEILLAK